MKITKKSGNTLKFFSYICVPSSKARKEWNLINMANLKEILNKDIKNINIKFNSNMSIALFTYFIWLIMNLFGWENKYFNKLIIKTPIIIKALHFIFMYFIFSKLFFIFKNRKTEQGKIEFNVFLIFYVILISILLLTWPGTWSWDDIYILHNASYFELTPWQHFFSGLFHIMCLQTLPLASGIIIIQMLIASFIMGYSASKISIIYCKNEKQRIVMCIIMILIGLLAPIVLYLLSGFRMGIYSFLELLLITKLIVIYKEKTEIVDIVKLGIITIIVSCWRTEAIYYPLIVLILLLLLGEKKIFKRFAFIFFVVVMLFDLAIIRYNNMLISNNNYSIAATIDPLVSIINNVPLQEIDGIEKIEKVINIEYIINNPNMTGEEYFWTTGVVKKYTPEQYTEYINTFIKLTLKYPKIISKSAWDILYKAISGQGIDGKQTTKNCILGSGNTLKLFDKNDGAGQKWSNIVSDIKQPFNLELRNKVILFICGVDKEGNINIFHRILWNGFIPIILATICLIYKFLKKDWFMLGLLVLVLARVPLLFITAPAPFFMYYLSIYLCSYVLSTIVFFEMINKKKIELKNKKQIETRFKIIINQFLSFMLVSGIGWMIDFSIYSLLTYFLGIKVLFANILSSIPAITYVFLMSNKKIFKNNNTKFSLKIKYIIYFIYQFFLILVVSILGEYLYSKLINYNLITNIYNNLKIIIKITITPITMILNFIAMKNLVEKL